MIYLALCARGLVCAELLTCLPPALTSSCTGLFGTVQPWTQPCRGQRERAPGGPAGRRGGRITGRGTGAGGHGRRRALHPRAHRAPAQRAGRHGWPAPGAGAAPGRRTHLLQHIYPHRSLPVLPGRPSLPVLEHSFNTKPTPVVRHARVSCCLVLASSTLCSMVGGVWRPAPVQHIGLRCVPERDRRKGVGKQHSCSHALGIACRERRLPAPAWAP